LPDWHWVCYATKRLSTVARHDSSRFVSALLSRVGNKLRSASTTVCPWRRRPRTAAQGSNSVLPLPDSKPRRPVPFASNRRMLRDCSTPRGRLPLWRELVPKVSCQYYHVTFRNRHSGSESPADGSVCPTTIFVHGPVPRPKRATASRNEGDRYTSLPPGP